MILTAEHRRIMAEFRAKGFAAMAWDASNPKYIEVYAKCNIIQFEDMLAALDYRPIGIGSYTERTEQWYTAWVSRHGS